MTAAAPGSLTRRLAISLTLFVSLFWVCAIAGAGFVIRHEIDEVLDSALQEVVQRVLPLAYSDILARDGDDTVEQQLADAGKHVEYITYVVRDDRGRILLRSHDAEPDLFPSDLKPGFEDRNDQRFYTESAVHGTLVVSAMERSGHRASTVRKSMLALALPMLLLLPAMIAAVFWLVSRALWPVAELGQSIALRGDRNLAPVEERGLPAEIAPVGVAVNALLARLSRALEAERSFTANSAHELRTPIAGALARTQQIMAELVCDHDKSRLMEVEASLQRLARLTEKLLQLAKADGGQLRAPAAQDVRLVVPHGLDGLMETRRIETHLPDHPVLSIIDIDAFAIALRNLVENALKHGAPGAPVTVSLDVDGTVHVTNQGPPLSQEMFARLLQRFERGETSADGSGLGLAIVDAIARGAGGNFTMISPLPNREDGVCMVLTLPTG